MHPLATGADTLAPGGAPAHLTSPARTGGGTPPTDLPQHPRHPQAPEHPQPPAPPRSRTTGAARAGVAARRLLGAAPELVALVAAAAVFGYRVGTPSPWRDEGATMVIADRSFGEIVELISRLDLVHAAYYLLVHALLLVEGSARLADAVPAVRLISVVAACGTAVLLVRVGRRLGSTWVGLGAALALVAAPLATRYAQEARAYALVMLATTLATLLMLRALDRPGDRRAWRWYSAALVLAALLNVISLLVVVAHAVFVRVCAPRESHRGWLRGAAAGLGVAAPFVLATFLQRGQVDWLYSPDADLLTGFYRAQYADLGLLLGVLAAAVLLVRLPGRADPRRLLPDGAARRVGATNRDALVLGLAWAVLPVVLLWLVSQAEPLYTWRYVIFTLPGTALVVGSLATVLRPVGLVVPLVLLGLSGLHMQGVYRDPHMGHAEDMVGVGEYVAAHARPGDAVLWVPGGPGHMRTLQKLYPERYARLTDVALERSAAATATITGVEKEPEQIADALDGRTRVWLIAGDDGLGQADDAVDREKAQLLLEGYRIRKVDTVLKFQVSLWQKLDTPPRTSDRPSQPRPAVPLGEVRAG